MKYGKRVWNSVVPAADLPDSHCVTVRTDKGRIGNLDLREREEPCSTHLRDEELGDPLRQFALLAREDHLQHVAVQLLHDDKHPLRRLKHALQVDDARVMQILEENRRASGRAPEHPPHTERLQAEGEPLCFCHL